VPHSLLFRLANRLFTAGHEGKALKAVDPGRAAFH
jgi:hypothetical protein